MKLAYLCFDFGIPVFGTKGASVHLREVVKALAGQGHELRVYSPAMKAQEATSEGLVSYRPLPFDAATSSVVRSVARDVQAPDHLANEWSRLLYNEQARRALDDELRAWQPAAIYERYSLFGYAGLELARRLGVPHLLEVNAPLTLEQEKYRRLVLKQTAEDIERSLFQQSDALFVVSQALASYAQRLGAGEGRISVLPNAVDPDRFTPDVEPAALGLEGKRLVGFVGSLKPWHDVDTLVDAVRLLHERCSHYHLVVVGDGPRREALEALQAPFLTLRGAVEHDEVPALLAAMDAVVVPYAPDGDPYFSPLKLFEAMAMARPVIGADVGQVSEVVRDGVNGLLYRPGDATDLAAKIESVFTQPEQAQAMSLAARQEVLAHYSWAGNALRIAQKAQELAGSGMVALG